MRLSKLYVRFYRSFNYDYERKARRSDGIPNWELIDGVWYPFIRVEIDPVVTAIVGANESGKSHLIGAIKGALTGAGYGTEDFCRYSTLYSVEQGQTRAPDLGVGVALTTEQDVESARAWCPVELALEQVVTVLRLDGGVPVVALSSGETHAISDVAALNAWLPTPFELRTDVPIPDSLTFDQLLERPASPLSSRRTRRFLDDFFARVSPDQVAAQAGELQGGLEGVGSPDEIAVTSAALGRSLLVDVARIDQESLGKLERAARDGHEGQVAGLTEQINRSLERHLNFARWWSQDRDFRLRVMTREHELVFTIRDRTGTEYSFGERSRGLMYFLSYYVQLKAHAAAHGAEVLLMDEPDAYLSSVGQQDLLRIFEDFARPADGARSDQVVYVTHSPFLINRNAGHRTRVLDKGTDQEGTRVVRDASRNHYEPLRSSIGMHGAEVALMGGTNLIVEGAADQVLLTGLAGLIRYWAGGTSRTLDLNDVTVVPAGSAASVPYVAYLARARGEQKPACVALLDGDKSGREAERKLRKHEVAKKRVLADEFVIVLSDWAQSQELRLGDGVKVEELEDLVPIPLAIEAACRYAQHLLNCDEKDLEAFKKTDISALIKEHDGRLWDGLAAGFEAAFDTHIDKVGFAKELVGFLSDKRDANPRRPAGTPDLEHNFGALISHLAERLGAAKRKEDEARRNRRLSTITSSFLADYPDGVDRDRADLMLREIEASLSDSVEDEGIKLAIATLRRDFALAADPLASVERYTEFQDQLQALNYAPRLVHDGLP